MVVSPASETEAGLFYAMPPEENTTHHLMQEPPIIGKVSFDSGETLAYTDPAVLLRVIQNELPYWTTSGFRYEILTDDPTVRKGADDILYDLFGEENPRPLEEYESLPAPGLTMGMT